MLADVTMWLRTRSVYFVALAMVLTSGSAVAMGSRSVLLPTVFSGGSGSFGFVLLSAVPMVVALAHALDGRGCPQEVAAFRPLWAADVALFIVATAVPAGSMVALRLCGLEIPWGAARNILVLDALTVVVVAVRPARHAVLAATTTMVATSSYPLYGAHADRVRFLQPDASPAWAWTVAAVLSAAAMLTVGASRRVSR